MFLRLRRRFFWRWLWDCARAGVRKSIKQSLSIITQECDKKCLFWDVLKVLVMLGRGAWSMWRWLEYLVENKPQAYFL